MKMKFLLILASGLVLSACQTTPDEPVIEEVEVEIEQKQTCVPLELLTKVDIPAVKEKRMTIVLIDNPPFDPIEQAEEREIVVEEARTIYVDSEGQEVIDICDATPVDGTATDGMVETTSGG